jgi:hypothetical protein
LVFVWRSRISVFTSERAGGSAHRHAPPDGRANLARDDRDAPRDSYLAEPPPRTRAGVTSLAACGAAPSDRRVDPTRRSGEPRSIARNRRPSRGGRGRARPLLSPISRLTVEYAPKESSHAPQPRRFVFSSLRSVSPRAPWHLNRAPLAGSHDALAAPLAHACSKPRLC